MDRRGKRGRGETYLTLGAAVDCIGGKDVEFLAGPVGALIREVAYIADVSLAEKAGVLQRNWISKVSGGS